MINTLKNKKQKIVFLVGPTAIGKTELSLAVAEEFNCEIISMDSMQIYKYMDIGTAKPTQKERDRVRHHLVDFVDPAEQYNVGCYVNDAEEAISDIAGRNRLPMFVGGTGMYMTRLLDGLFTLPEVSEEIRNRVHNDLMEMGHAILYEQLSKVDPESARRIHPNDSQRLTRAIEIWEATGIQWSRYLAIAQKERARNRARYETLKIGLNCEREMLYSRINKRTDIMIENGLLAEVEWLLSMGYSKDLNPMQSIGYKHIINYIDKVWGWNESITNLARDTRHYAKRQLTWFGGDEEIQWFKPDEIEEVKICMQKFVRQSSG